MSDPKLNDLNKDYVELTDEQATRIRGGATLAQVGLQAPTMGTKLPNTEVVPCKHDPTRNCCY